MHFTSPTNGHTPPPRPCDVGGRQRQLTAVLGVLALVLLSACSVAREPPPSRLPMFPVSWEEGAVAMADGLRLPATRWLPEEEPRGVVLALHGFAEYGGAFYALAPHLSAAGYAVYAYDQRGFGRTASRGRWAGQARLVADARTALERLRARHPGRPVYLLGHSMGAAVAMLAMTGPDAVRPAGAVLVAPAVHGWDSLPLIQRLALQLGNALFPAARPQQRWAHRFAEITVTDDPRVQRVQAADPNYLRAIRIDMIHGVVELMDQALERTGGLPPETLILYGARDDIIPRQAACNLLERLAGAPPRPRLALYPDGHHYLMRDRQRRKPIRDVIAWLDRPTAGLPSGLEVTPAQARRRLCEHLIAVGEPDRGRAARWRSPASADIRALGMP